MDAPWFDDHDPATPALLLAPPGCGKTENLALWAKSLFDRRWIRQPQQVLALSYSRKAAANLRDRLRTRLGGAAFRYVRVSTFHGWAERVLRAHGHLAGFQLADRMAAPQRLEGIRKAAARRHREDDAAVQVTLRRVKTAGLEPEEVRRRLQAQSPAAAEYQDELEKLDGGYDFDDLIGQALRVLSISDVAELYRCRHPAVIVDEVQDLTLQHLSLASLHEPVSRVFAGDPTQGIFRFAGAEPVRVLRAIRESGPREVELTRSYRSAPAVLEVVGRLGEPLGATQIEAAEPGRWVGCSSFTVQRHLHVEAESEWVLQECTRLLELDHVTTVGIMTRTGGRRRWVDNAMEDTRLAVERWDDVMHSPDALALLRRYAPSVPAEDLDPAGTLERSCLDSLDENVDVDAAIAVRAACDELRGRVVSTRELQDVIRQMRVASAPDDPVGPGVHLLNGHLGKGQQFDAVIVVGLEEMTLPSWWAVKAEEEGDGQEVLEELAVLRVMASRARHHLALSWAARVADKYDRWWDRDPSRFLDYLDELRAGASQ